MITNIIIEKAIEEIEIKSLGVTKQFLQVHKIIYADGKPQVARVDLDKKDEAIVYFNVMDEIFFSLFM